MIPIMTSHDIFIVVNCEWSEWYVSKCTATCNSPNTAKSLKTKTRRILQQPINGGRECGNKYTEVEECNDLPFCTCKWQRIHFQTIESVS